MKDGRKIFHIINNQERFGVAILISGTKKNLCQNFSINKVIYVFIKGSIYQEDVRIINTHTHTQILILR